MSDADSTPLKLPKMINRPNECQRCYSVDVCTLSSLTFDQSPPAAGNFPKYKDIADALPQQVRSYFHLKTECVMLEQNQEKQDCFS